MIDRYGLLGGADWSTRFCLPEGLRFEVPAKKRNIWIRKPSTLGGSTRTLVRKRTQSGNPARYTGMPVAQRSVPRGAEYARRVYENTRMLRQEYRGRSAVHENARVLEKGIEAETLWANHPQVRKQTIRETDTSLGYGTESPATTLGNQKGIRIGTWNIRTLAQASRLAQLAREMTRCKTKILGLSEVRWKDSGDITTPDNHYMIFSGNSTSHINEVGIIMTTEIKRSLIGWNPVSDRIITARFRTKNRNVTIIQCYAPTEATDDNGKDHFYNQLQSTIAAVHRKDVRIVMGDFNGKIGSNNNNLTEIMGFHGLGETRSNNGERLIDLCMANHLFIGGTRFPHKDIHKYT
ncbi:craniofacial development protein 2-like [Linepithema humile]|uniref:craniofacial development protein 2-like n=1 Tax=Linepithema humile TaxID=83485 RepID=UPI00351DB8B4